MFKLARKREYPIGIDLGLGSLKIVQLVQQGDTVKLLAAAKADVPAGLLDQPADLQHWYLGALRDLLATRGFKGRQVVTCLPTRDMVVRHIRMPRMDEPQLKKALAWEAQDKIPFDVKNALLRHIVAGEVYEASEAKLEVILLAAPYGVVQRHLNLLEKAKLDIKTVNVEPRALIDGFAAALAQDAQPEQTTMFLDLAHSGTKVVMAHGDKLTFCRSLAIGAEDLRRCLCEQAGLEYASAVRAHLEYGTASASSSACRSSGGAATACVGADVEQIIDDRLERLCDELRDCIRYHDLTFDGSPVGRVVFVGGQAKNKALSQKVAAQLGLPAQLGDPLRGIELAPSWRQVCDLDENQPNGEWAVAFGLSLRG